MTGPIKPSQVTTKKTESLPPEVFEVFNELIAQNWDGRKSIVKQKDAADRIAAKLEMKVDDVYQRKYLDIEDSYRKVGWKVVYDKPGFNEDYPATFEFTKRTRSS